MSVKYALKVAPEAGGDRTDRGRRETDRRVFGGENASPLLRRSGSGSGLWSTCGVSGQMPVVRPRAKARRELHDDCPSLLTPPHLNLTLTSFSSAWRLGG